MNNLQKPLKPIFLILLLVIQVEVHGQINTTAVGRINTGSYAGYKGDYNVNIGPYAGYSGNSGTDQNVYIGYRSGYINTSGDYNTYVGTFSGELSTGSYNSFFGRAAGTQNKGSYNVFMGYNSGWGNGSGYDNVFLGYGSGYSADAGYRNIYIGREAGYTQDNGDYNVFIGYRSGYNAETNDNILIGQHAGYSVTGAVNVAIGKNAMRNTSSGGYNMMIGAESGYRNTTGNHNVYMGEYSGHDINGSYNVALGSNAGAGYTGSSGTRSGNYNTSVGYRSGHGINGGERNTYLGAYSGGYSNSTGDYNAMTGSYSGRNNTTGSYNVFNGYESGRLNTSGSSNTAIGYKAGYRNTTGSGNVFIGKNAGATTNVSNQLFINNIESNYPLIWGDFSSNNVKIYGNFSVGTPPSGSSFTVNYSSGNVFTQGSISTAAHGSSTNWKQAYDWGNHAAAGYQLAGSTLTGIPSITTVAHGSSANWKQAYDWGNHASAGYYKAGATPSFGSITSTGSIQTTNGNDRAYLSTSNSSALSQIVWGDDDGDRFRFYFDHHSGTDREVMSLLSNGNVGIGQISPAEKLHINGSIRGNQSGALRINSGNGWVDVGAKNTSWAHFDTDRSRFYFSKPITVNGGAVGSYDENLSLQTSGTTRIFVSNANGNVGIGTTDPSAKLDLVGNAEVNGNLLTTGTISAGGQDSNDWNSAFDWVNANGSNTVLSGSSPTFNAISTSDGSIRSSSGSIKLMKGVRADDSSYEWVGYYSGNVRQGIILYDGQWTGANNSADEFSITAENGNKLTLNTNGDHIALMPDGTGKVGVGILTPSAKMEVRHSGTIGGKFDESKSFLTLSDGNLKTIMDPNEIYNNETMHFGSAGGFRFRKVTSTGATDWMTINSSGNMFVNGNFEAAGVITANSIQFDLAGLNSKESADSLLVVDNNGTIGYRSAGALENPWLVEIVEANGEDLSCLAYGGTVEVDILDVQGNLMIGPNKILDDDPNMASTDFGDDWISFDHHVSVGSASGTKGLVLYGPTSTENNYLNLHYASGSSYFTNDWGYSDGGDRFFLKATGRNVTFGGNVTSAGSITTTNGDGNSAEWRAAFDWVSANGANDYVETGDSPSFGTINTASHGNSEDWNDAANWVAGVSANETGWNAASTWVGTHGSKFNAWDAAASNLTSNSANWDMITTPGNGLTWSGSNINVAVGNGLEIVSDAVRLQASVADAGLAYTNGRISVNPGEGILVSGDQVGLNSSVAGNGLTYTAGVMSITEGVGIDVTAGGISLDGQIAGNALTWNAGTGKLDVDASAVTPWSNASGNLSFESGKVGIGIAARTDYALTVKGEIYTDRVRVVENVTSVPDYVFESDYDLQSLAEVEAYVKKEKHLPNVPSAKEIAENGLDLGEMNMKLLEKVEELTLHLIAQEKAMKEKDNQLLSLAERLEKLEQIIQEK